MIVLSVTPVLVQSVFKRVELFHTDSVVCGLSALAMRTNAPTVLREEALDYVSTRPKGGACVFGDKKYVKPEKAIAANIAGACVLCVCVCVCMCMCICVCMCVCACKCDVCFQVIATVRYFIMPITAVT